MKTFYLQSNIGSARYVVNFSDGTKTYNDGSVFFDICIFKNKKDRNLFVRGLRKRGFIERGT